MAASRVSIPLCPQGSRYSHGCRCSFCRKQIAGANARYLHKRDQRERGIQFDDDLIDAGPTRELLVQAQKYKLTDRDLEKMTGMTKESFSRIRTGKSKRVLRRTAQLVAEALEDHDIAERHPMTLVDAKWTHQMSLSLVAQGWSRQHQRDIIYNNLGETAGFIGSRPPHRRPKQVYYKNQQIMRWLVRAIGDRQGPAMPTAKKMWKRGIFPTRHYNLQGDLILTSLSKEQRAMYDSV